MATTVLAAFGGKAAVRMMGRVACFRTAISRIEIHQVNVVFRIDLPSACICLGLLFRVETWRVIHIVAENPLAILAILSGIEDVLMPEFVHFKRRRRNGMFRAVARESIEKSSVFEFHLCRLFGAPTQMIDDSKPN
jgi:hypothetical protein